MYTSKLADFRFMRANVHVKFALNASVFSTGRILAAFAPYENYVGNRSFISTLPGVTCYPFAEIDIGSGATPELVIPYASPTRAFDLTTGTGTLGTLNLSILNSFRSSTTADSCTLSLYAWFEDVALSVPTANPVPILQSGFEPYRFGVDWADVYDDETPQTTTPQPSGQPCPMPENPSPTPDEQTNKSSTGIISSAIKTVGSLTSAASRIPFLPSWLNPVGWFIRKIGKAAESYGFSKPDSTQALSRMIQIPAFGFSHGSGLDPSVTLAIAPDNAIAIDPSVFGSSVDEMDIAYACKKQCLLSILSWSTSSPSGSVLGVFRVAPDFSTYSATAGFYPSIMFYVSNFFNYWRGDIRYRFSAVKNAYYSGRLKISFYPGLSDAPPVQEGGMEWIFDVKLNSELELTCPFNTASTFLSTNRSTSSAATPYNSSGVLVVSVLNPLKCPDSVPSQIDVDVFCAAGANFALAGPIGPFWLPDPSLVILQSGSGPLVNYDTQTSKEPEPIVPIRPTTDLAELRSIGESVTSIRTLVARSSFWYSVPAGTTNTTTFVIDPFLLNSYGWNVYPPPVVYFSYMYRFCSGSLRVKIFDKSTTVSRTRIESVVDITYGPFDTPPTWSVYQFDQPSGRHITYSDLNPVHEITMPFYANGLSMLLSAHKQVNGQARPYVLVRVTSQTTTPDLDIFLSAGDDFSFGYLVAPPPITIGGAPRPDPNQKKKHVSRARNHFCN